LRDSKSKISELGVENDDSIEPEDDDDFSEDSPTKKGGEPKDSASLQ